MAKEFIDYKEIENVQVVSCSLKELFASYKEPILNTSIRGQLTIPEYQRPYIWKKKQINQILDSLLEHYENKVDSKPMYYLGTILLHQENGKLNVIDGQQRITTSLLFLKLLNPSFKSGLNYTSGISINNIKYNLSYLKDIEDEKIFDYRGKNVLNYFNPDDINITLIVTSTEDLAYTFFETQNSGGVRLDGSDILKAHHLRAIKSKKLINYQARKWEKYDNNKVEYIIQHLTKIRFWDNRKWRFFPFYRDKINIKNAIIDEYTLNTKNNYEDISYHYSAVKNIDGRLFQLHESRYKQLKQPLSNGNNTLDFIHDYIELYNILFENNHDYKVSDLFYEFRERVIDGNNGTIFLKELFEISIIAYVSRFGFYKLYEASLWLFRMIYSLRVTMQRNVREDSIFKFVQIHQFIDNIIEVFTPNELFIFLKKFEYKLDINYLDKNSAKKRYIDSIKDFFHSQDSNFYYKYPDQFDMDLMNSISEKIKKNE